MDKPAGRNSQQPPAAPVGQENGSTHASHKPSAPWLWSGPRNTSGHFPRAQWEVCSADSRIPPTGTAHRWDGSFGCASGNRSEGRVCSSSAQRVGVGYVVKQPFDDGQRLAELLQSLRIGKVTHLTHWVRIKCESDAGDGVGVRGPGCVDGFERGRGGFKPQAHVGWEWTFVHGANVPGNMPRSSSSTWR